MERRIVVSMARIPKALAMAVVAAVLLATMVPPTSVEAFTSSPSSLLEPRTAKQFGCQCRRRGNHRTPVIQPLRPSSPPSSSSPSSSTSLNVLGGDSGILGVGAPEIAVVLLVGYFVLGPSDLYKLVKEVGKFIQNIRSLGSEAATAFEGTMENQLELTELRKAQAELNEAFSFRRSINTYEGADAFDKTSFSENSAAAEAEMGVGASAVGAAAAAGASTATASEEGTAPPKRKRRLVRRKKKKAVEEVDVPSESDVYPDLDMLDVPDLTTTSGSDASGEEGGSDEEKLRAERLERLSGGKGESSSTTTDASSSEPDWFNASEEEIASEVLNNNRPSDATVDPAMESYEKQRFASQLSAEQWNSQIMENEDELAPLSMVMKRLAILEEEKNAADRRLEEEYQKRMDNEDKYYLEKRKVLEDAVTDIQENVYGTGGGEKEKETVVEKENNATKFTA